MYLDQILFILGGIALLAGLILGVVLLQSRKKVLDYRRVLDAETQRVDVSLLTTQMLDQSGRPLPNTVKISDQDSMETELLDPDQMGVQGSGVGSGLDLSVLEGKYELLQEIHRGGMSRIFLARHVKLGNEWIVKFVDKRQAELADEAEVLKKLNHISLPQIIDIFQSEQGTFLVERYIEGVALDQVLRQKADIKESQVCDWGLQLSWVLHYMHNLDTPIIHCDLKPSNIMVTHDNRLMLIDFGISRRQGVSEKEIGLTYNYAAPEQFRGQGGEAVRRRFGTLPAEAASWPVDARTDLYSLGVILYELLVGKIPGPDYAKELQNCATPQLAQAISRCLEVEPSKRVQSAQELAQMLESAKSYHLTVVRSLTLRRVAAVCCGVLLAGGLATSASGAYIGRMENLSVISMDPGRAVVTAQQSVQLLIQKQTPNGNILPLDTDKMNWSYSQNNIARLDNGRLTGLNVGETTLYGQYRNKTVELNVTVTEPVGDTTAIALRYQDGVQVSQYAGTGAREWNDGSQAACSFVSPERMAADGGRLYISDSGKIRVLENGTVSTTTLEPDYLAADLIRGWNGNTYLLTSPWTGDDGNYYGFVRLSDSSAEVLYYTEADWSTVTDFCFSSDGTLWFIQNNMGTGTVTLNTLDVNTLESAWVMDLPDGTRNMAFDGSDNLYLTVPDEGLILLADCQNASWSYFAGLEGERNLIDGAVPCFYRPTSLAADGNTLYVLDFDTVRKITIENGAVQFTETLAGVPTEDTNPAVVLGDGQQAILPASDLASLTLDGNGRLLLSDPKNSVIYEIAVSN